MTKQMERDINWLKHQIKLAESRKETEIYIGSKSGIEREKGNSGGINALFPILNSMINS